MSIERAIDLLAAYGDETRILRAMEDLDPETGSYYDLGLELRSVRALVAYMEEQQADDRDEDCARVESMVRL